MPETLPPIDAPPTLARKVRRRLLPLLMASWFVAYIDRFNVSFAALQMNEDLSLSATVFGLGAGLFFVGYSVFEVPSNIMLARFGARRWLARIMVTWGLVSTATAVVQGPGSFYALRFLLGAAEAGCFPVMAAYLQQWLPARERAAALGLLGSVAMVSGVAGAPLAAALLSLDGLGGLAGWQWLFIVEGLPAVVLGCCIWRFLPDRPEQVAALTADERAWVHENMARETAAIPIRRSLGTIVADSRYWIWAAAFFCIAGAGTALRFFQPLSLQRSAGLSDALAALLTAVPAIVATVAIVYVGRHSTRVNERRWHAALPACIAGIGLAAAGFTNGLATALIAASIAHVGVGSQPPLFASVGAASTGATNAVAIAFVNAIAALGGFVGPYAVGFLIDGTGSLAFAFAIAGAVLSLGGVMALAVREHSGDYRRGLDTSWRPASVASAR